MATSAARKSSTLRKTEKEGRKEKEDFKWTDDESELLLSVTHEYKVKKLSESIDWESVRTKYDDILTLMCQELPDTAEEARENCGKDYPHTKEKITKKVLTSKLIRIKFREAVDSGRRSGHGRVVLLYYELCEDMGRFASHRRNPNWIREHRNCDR